MIHDATVIIADCVLGIVPRVVLAILCIVAAKICAAILVTGKLVCVGIGFAEDAQIFAVFIGAVQSFYQAVLITVVSICSFKFFPASYFGFNFFLPPPGFRDLYALFSLIAHSTSSYNLNVISPTTS